LLFRHALAAAALALTGCATFDFAGNRNSLFDTAAEQSWRREFVASKPFTPLLTLWRQRDDVRGLPAVYIEGDGLAWLDRTTISADPTPLRPVALRLALADPNAVLYIGRPCQYPDEAPTAKCDPRYWTSHRYAPEVVEALSTVIDRSKGSFGGDIELIGYSGGGVLAALIAARRTDVARIVTVAANLDLAAWTRTLGVDPMTASLDPAREAERIGGIRQYHLVGALDKAVPPSVVRSYIEKSPGPGERRIMEIVPDYDHDCCWHRDWSRRLAAIRRSSEPNGWAR
jgi:pimeloyl-ACP methyl ester carboxylesterase